MVELPWGLRPRDGGPRVVNVIRSEGRTFPTHRCLDPASEFRHTSFTFSLANGDWFHFAGIWRPAAEDWPKAYAILTIECRYRAVLRLADGGAHRESAIGVAGRSSARR
ncbi:hypothetical protein EV184_102459 [Sinorhizobium americanum]|uniref:Uncharacterized protein n=1 Tax=Sinorhizobium americanum TaxID=194963 RepID=A0A4R2C185_9HYPH|nr:hypothetical protein EV184_102459 [Sinorhizobium americanum]